MVEALPLIMFAVLLLFILCGFPVAFTLAGTALLFAWIGHSIEFDGDVLFYWDDLGFLPSRVFGITNKYTLVAVPLFVFMGITLEKSGIAEDLLKTISKMFQNQRGSLAIAVVLVGALLAASTGIVGATVVTMGVLSLPTMLSQGYGKGLATGTIAASGTLGQIIPPSIVFVLLGDMMNVDVGDLFVGAIIPGVILVGLYLIYLVCLMLLKHKDMPGPPPTSISTPMLAELGRSIVPPVSLMVVVLGSILGGIASPTEAASCGAVGALVIVLAKGRLTKVMLWEVMQRTASITAMVFMILVGAQFFGVVFRGLAGDDVIQDLVMSTGTSPTLVLFFLMLMIFILGFFLDFLEICFIVIPIIMPIIVSLGFDPLWIAILIAVNLQTSFLTPPFGFALFYLKGVAPKEVATMDIYRGVVPFVIMQIIGLVILFLIPAASTWLPRQVF